MAINSQLMVCSGKLMEKSHCFLLGWHSGHCLEPALFICLAPGNKMTYILLLFEFCLWLNSQVAGRKEVDYGCSQVDGNWGARARRYLPLPAPDLILWPLLVCT